MNGKFQLKISNILNMLEKREKVLVAKATKTDQDTYELRILGLVLPLIEEYEDII